MKKNNLRFVCYSLRRFDSIILACMVSFLCHQSVFGAGTGSASKNDGTAIRLPENGTANKKKTAEAKSSKKVTVVFEGEIYGEGTFSFQKDQIVYKHSQQQYPKNVTINGEPWTDLDEPFLMDYILDYSTTTVTEKIGRNSIKVTPSPDSVVLYINDTAASSGQYRVSMNCSVISASGKKSSANQNKEAAQKNDSTSKNDTAAKQEKTTVVQEPIGNRPEDKLPAAFYDLKRYARAHDTAKDPRRGQTFTVSTWLSILNKFVNGYWMNSTNSDLTPVYQDFSTYYRYNEKSVFYSYFTPNLSPASEIRSQLDPKDSMTSGWVGIHFGYVKAPFTGKFRFVGSGTDALAVHFEEKLVLDYGRYSLSLGKEIRSPADCRPTKKTGMSFGGNGLYDNFSVYSIGGRTVAQGLPISVIKGKSYPIEILYSVINGSEASFVLYIERLDNNGKPLNEKPSSLPLFRTTTEMPSSTSTSTRNGRTTTSSASSYDSDSPIWRVVDNTGKPWPTGKALKIKKQ